MTATTMPSPRGERKRRVIRWLLPAALLAFIPKCLLCLLGYAGLGAAVGLRGPEMCGASPGSPASWASSLAWLGGAVGVIALFAASRCRRSAPLNATNG